MDKDNVARATVGMHFQLIGLFMLIGGSSSPDVRLLAALGIVSFVVGFVIYADEHLSALKYLRDWLCCFFMLQTVTTVVLFFLMFQREIAFPVSLVAFVSSGLLSYILLRLFKRVNRKYAASKKAAAPAEAAIGPAKTAADKQQKADASAGKAHAAAAQAAQTTAPAQKREASVEEQIAAMAARLKEATNPPTVQAERRAPAVSQEAFYGLIDAEASALPPNEADLYTAEGQALLLEAAVHALPQLEMLCAPGFPGDRLLHAADGAQAYDAMRDLVSGIHDVLESCSRSQLQATLSGVSHDDALLTWKAFRFYGKIMGGEEGFEEVFALLADRV